MVIAIIIDPEEHVFFRMLLRFRSEKNSHYVYHFFQVTQSMDVNVANWGNIPY